ncbi:MAG: hypothetical protein JHC95_06145 [Solirubrobacteraceae bacterium]|nr:hypothetical protein [Solirubrobacteraceae bacterium]
MVLRRLIALMCAFALLASVAAPLAAAQGGSGPLLQPPAETVSTEPPPDEESRDDGLGTFSQILIFVAAAALIGGIGFVIVRDARRNAPADARPQRSDEEAGGPAKAKQRARDRDRRRAKAKQARKQRKRNR